MVAGPQSGIVQHACQAAGPLVELGVRADRAALGVDRGRAVGRRLRVLPRVLHRHERPPGNIQIFTPELYVLRTAAERLVDQSRILRLAKRPVDHLAVHAGTFGVGELDQALGPGRAA